MCTFKNYCWSLGTTSFRTKDFNKKIEEQIQLMDKFWAINPKEKWDKNDKIQSEYYDFLKINNFVTTEANNKAKDAREKTSALVDIGLLNSSRKLTGVGKKLLKMSIKGDFTSDNIIGISSDSYIYLLQLLKTVVLVNNDAVRPLPLIFTAILQFGYLDFDEFKYLLPLIKNSVTKDFIFSKIQEIRQGKSTIDKCIVDIFMLMDNYQQALKIFLDEAVSPDLICKIGLNRKSRNYDLCYYDVYVALNELRKNQSVNNILSLLHACKKLRLRSLWIEYIFDKSTPNAIKKLGINAIKPIPIFKAKSEEEFKKEFFQLMHLFKIKQTLHDYFDLHRRYVSLTECVRFHDEKVEFTLIAKSYFSLCDTGLEQLVFNKDVKELENDIAISNILPNYDITEESFKTQLLKDYPESEKYDSIDEFINQERLKRFNELIDKKFDDNSLIKLLDAFEARNDGFIKDTVTDNADVPTIFEYIIGLIWYKISDKSGDILKAYNLSLDADLLPKSHAGGGMEDISYQYISTEDYPDHTLLIEVTLADKINQRRMEMEPVSRHLGDYLLAHGQDSAYAVFVSPYLHPNVISDFRARKDMWYYNNTADKYFKGMKIIPLTTVLIKKFLSNKQRYSNLYSQFEKIYKIDIPPMQWYDECLSKI